MTKQIDGDLRDVRVLRNGTLVFSTLGLYLCLVQVACSGSSGTSDPVGNDIAIAEQAIGEAETVSVGIPLPIRVPPSQIALGATMDVKLNDRAVLTPLDHGGSVMSSYTGSQNSLVGADAVAGHLFVNSPLEIRDRAGIRGSVYYSSSLSRGNDVNIFGTVQPTTTIPMELVILAAYTPPVGAGATVM